MNKYGSALRSIPARNILTGIIAPDYTVTIEAGTYRQVFDSFRFDNRTDSNFLIKQVMLAANYGRGLVLRSPQPRLTLSIRTGHVTSSVVLDGTAGQADEVITGTGAALYLTNPDLAKRVAQWDLVQFLSGGARLQFAQDVVSDTEITASDLQIIAAGSNLIKVNYANDIICGSLRDLNFLNQPYMLEKYVPQALHSFNIATQTTPPQIVYAELTVSDDIQYLTTSINQGYVGETVMFDVVADFEITPQ